jgi:hypothetical protein
MDNSEANRSQKGGGRSMMIPPLPHNPKGGLSNIIYQKVFNEQKTATEAAVTPLKSPITTRDHTHRHMSRRYNVELYVQVLVPSCSTGYRL